MAKIRVKAAGALYEFLAPSESWRWNCTRAEDSTGADVNIIWVYCHQDAEGVQSWYAFACAQDRALHQSLMEVDGVGAKKALEIMARNLPGQLLRLIHDGDREGFSLLKGLGGVIGKRLIDHLFKTPPPAPKAAIDTDAVKALVKLGFKTSEAREKVQAIQKELPEANTADIITKALR